MQKTLSEEKQLKQTIANGSKSFRLASLFLSKKKQKAAYVLYRWCRYCDDQIDNALDLSTAQQRWVELCEQTHQSLRQDVPQLPTAFRGLHHLHHDCGIPASHFFDLLEGFKMDVAATEIQTEHDLEKYCYHVAGVVGLLMSPILEVKDNKALHHADVLGRAMQLTNICRDIAEDHKNGRIYIPSQWLQNVGLDRQELLRFDHLDASIQKRIWPLAFRLLNKADQKYDEGRLGLGALPFRAGLSISVASHLYQKIGHKLKAIGPKGLGARTVLNSIEKLTAIMGGVSYYLLLVLKNLMQKKKKAWVLND